MPWQYKRKERDTVNWRIPSGGARVTHHDTIQRSETTDNDALNRNDCQNVSRAHIYICHKNIVFDVPTDLRCLHSDDVKSDRADNSMAI